MPPSSTTGAATDALRRVPEFDGLRLRLRRIDSGFGELDFCQDDSSKDPFAGATWEP